MPTRTRLKPERVAALHASMRGYVERGELPGAVTLLACGDDIHVDALGQLSTGGSAAMARDSLFRISSMTKPIAAAAAMLLIEDGKLQLDGAVDPWLPELANRQVLRSIDAALDDTVPAKRAISVRDLLTLCLGFGSVLARPGSCPIQKPIHDLHVGGDGPEYMLVANDPDRYLRHLGSLPLMYQPGERWAYNVGSDVLGILVARVAGTSLEDSLRARIFEPLGMKDTAFSVPPSKLSRLAGCYRWNSEQKQLELFDSAEQSFWSQPPSFESGAGGLISSADDYFAFCRMLLNKGSAGKQRILSVASVEAMTRDQVSAQQRKGAEMFFGAHCSWGFGMSVDIAREQPWHVPGRFGWDGGLGSSAYSDPQHDFVGILLTQRLMDSPDAPALYESFWSHAYQALES